jgi:hypothetical protein
MQETFRPTFSRTLSSGAYDEIVKPTFGDIASAAFAEGETTNITPSLMNLLPKTDKSKVLTPEEANKKYQIGNLKFNDPIGENTAKELYDKQFAQLRRQEIMRMGPQGFAGGAVKFGAGLASTFTDPVGLVASALVPELLLAKGAKTLGGAAKTYMTARAGQTIGQRATFGAVEGAAGAALFEPLVYLSQQKDQLDYGVADSFLNIAFGGILGGGIHAAGRGLELRAEKADQIKIQARDRLDRDVNNLIDELDSLDRADRAALTKTALNEVLQDQMPKNIDAALQRLSLDRAVRGGLSEVTFKVDGTLTDSNFMKLKKRSNGDAVGAIPVAKFTSNSEVDAYIKSTGKERTQFISQRDSSGNLIVSEIRKANVVRDDVGGIRVFKGREEAQQYIKDTGGTGNLISLQKRQGASEQSHIVVNGITPAEAKLIQQDPSFVDFYEPRFEPPKEITPELRQKFVDSNSIKVKDYKFDPNDTTNAVDFDETDVRDFDDFVDDIDVNVDTVMKYADEIEAELKTDPNYFSKEQIDALAKDMDEYNYLLDEKDALKLMGVCMRQNV